MKKTIKFLIVALAFALLLSVSAVAILASNEAPTYTSWVETSEGADDGALVYDEVSGTYKLRGNLTTAETYTTEADVVIDLNGYSITNTAEVPMFTISAGTTLTLRGSGTLNTNDSAVQTENGGKNTPAILNIEAFGKGITVNSTSTKHVFNLGKTYAELNVSGKLNITFTKYYSYKQGNSTYYQDDNNGAIFSLANRWTKANISNAEIHIDPAVSGIGHRAQIFYLGYATEVNITGSVIDTSFGHMFAYKSATSANSVWGTPVGDAGSAMQAFFDKGFTEPTRINVIGSTLVADTYAYSTSGSAGGILGISNAYIMFYGEDSLFQSSGRMFTGSDTYRKSITDPPGKFYFDGCTFNILDTDYGSSAIFFNHVNSVTKNCTYDSLSTIASKGIWQPNGGYGRAYVPVEDANGNAITAPKNFDEQGTGTLLMEGCVFPDYLDPNNKVDFSGITEIDPEYEECYIYKTVAGKIYVSTARRVTITDTTVTYNEETGLYETVVTTTTLNPQTNGTIAKTVTSSEPTTAATGTPGTTTVKKYGDGNGYNFSGRIYTIQEGFSHPTYAAKYVWRNGELVKLNYAIVNSNSPFVAAQQHNFESTPESYLDYKYVPYYTYGPDGTVNNPYTNTAANKDVYREGSYFLKGETTYHPDNEVDALTTPAGTPLVTRSLYSNNTWNYSHKIFSELENGAKGRGGIFFQERFTDGSTGYSNTYFVLQASKSINKNGDAYLGVPIQDAGYSSATPTSTSYIPNNAYIVSDLDISTLGRNDYTAFSYMIRYNTTDSAFTNVTVQYKINARELTPGEWRHLTFVLEVITKDNGDGTIDLSETKVHIYVDGVHKSSSKIVPGLTAFKNTWRIGIDQIRVSSWSNGSDDATVTIDNNKTVYYPKGYTGDLSKAIADKSINLRECDDVTYNARYKAPASSVLVTVDGQAFSNMEDALTYAQPGDEIILFGDAGTTDTPIAVEKDLIINTNGHEFIYTSSSRLSVEYGDEVLFKEASDEDYAIVEWYNYESELITTDKYPIGTNVSPVPNDGKTIKNVLEGNNGWYDLKFSHFVNEAGKKPENVLLNKAGTYKFTPAFETPVADVDGIKYNLTTYSYFQYNIYVPTTTPENVTYLGTFSGPNGKNSYSNYGAGTINGVPYNQYCAWPGVATTTNQHVYVRFSVTVGETTTELDYYFSITIPKYATQVLQNPTMSETSLKLIASMANYCNETIKLINGSYPAEWARAMELAEPYIAASDAYDERIANTAAGTAPTALAEYLDGVSFLFGDYQPRFAFKYDITPDPETGAAAPIDYTKIIAPGRNGAVTRNDTSGIYINIAHGGLLTQDYGAYHYSYKDGVGYTNTEYDPYDEANGTYNDVYAMSNNTRVFDIDEVLTIKIFIDGNAVATGTYSLADYIKYQETVASSTDGTYTAEEIAAAQQTVVASKALYAYAMASEAYKTGN